jgi:hypothetical protein
MDAGIAGATQKGRLRQQILSGEQDIAALSGQQQQPLAQQLQFQQQQFQQQFQNQQFQQQQFQQNLQNLQNHHFQQNQPYNNYDLMTPLPTVNATGSRKASLTSQSGMNKFFRRHKQGAFDEETGADISDLTSGANVSFDDITHIRDRGPYGLSTSKALDTTPIIPTLGGGSKSLTGSNNIEYRKQMNHNKKMAFASGARAMSLAGGNPMQKNQHQQQFIPQGSDPRAMSLSAYGPGYNRAMSLNSNAMNANPQHTMSLTHRGPPGMGPPMGRQMGPGQMGPPMGPGQMGPMGPSGPRAMSVRSNGNPMNPPFGSAGPGPMGGPRTMSLNSNGKPQFYPPGQVPQGQVLQGQPPQGQPLQFQPPQGQYAPNPRTMSLNSNGGGPVNGQANGLLPNGLLPNGILPNGGPPTVNGSTYRNNNPSYGHGLQPPPPPQQTNTMYQSSNSNDSLMNVVEEEEEQQQTSPQRVPTLAPPKRKSPAQFESNTVEKSSDTSLPLCNSTFDDEEAIYQFEREEDNSSLSRKSTLKKSNSMRLRKINLFSNETPHNLQNSTGINEIQEDHTPSSGQSYNSDRSDEEFDTSPSFNMRRRDYRESMVESSETGNSNTDNYRMLGANANNGSNATSLNKDVFVTASDFTSNIESPPKNNVLKNTLPSPTKSSNLPSPTIDTASGGDNMTTQQVVDDDDTTITSLEQRGSPKQDTWRSKKHGTIKSLVTNTAFSNFRSASNGSAVANHTLQSEDLNELPEEDKGSIYSSEEVASQAPAQASDFSRDLYENSQSQEQLNSKEYDEFPPQTKEYEEFEPQTKGDDEFEPQTKEQYEIPSQTEVYKTTQVNEPTNQFDTVPSRGSDKSSTYQDKFTSHQSSDKSSTYHDVGLTTPTTDNTSNVSSYQNPYTAITEPIENSMRSTNTSDLFNTSLMEDNSFNSDQKSTPKAEKRTSGRFSLTNKSRNLLKRLSKSKKKEDIDDDASFVLNRNSIPNTFTPQSPSVPVQRRMSSNVSNVSMKMKEPLVFTKQELSIMNCNNDLLNELELVTTELASSIKRELSLENRVKNSLENRVKTSSGSDSPVDINYELTAKLKIILDLQEKLNKERRLRFVSEEHALLLENGQNPSPLKLNYEKTEIYKQLLIKNDLVHQLEDKLDEYERKNNTTDQDLLNKYNDLLNENANLKFNVIPELEKRVLYQQQEAQKGMSRQLSLVNIDYDESYDESQEAILTLRSQREELREVVSTLTSNHQYETKLAQDKIKTLETKLQETKKINDKLSKRLNHTEESNHMNHGNGGKLQGFTIVSPTKKFYDKY